MRIVRRLYCLEIYDALGRKIAHFQSDAEQDIPGMREQARNHCTIKDSRYLKSAPHYILYEEREKKR